MTTTDATTTDNADHSTSDSSTVDIRDDLRLFVGKNVGEYERLINIYADKTPTAPVGFKFSFALTGLFFSWPWLMYRKMNTFAFIAFIVPVVEKFLNLGSLFVLAIAIVTCFGGKTIYIRGAVKKVREIRANANTPDQALERIEQAGGVNNRAILLGGVMYGLFLVVMVIGATTLLIDPPQ